MMTGLSGLLCLFLAVPADAQRGGGHSGGGGSRGGGGGGSHFSGGGGGGRSFSGGGGRSFSGGSRPSGGFSAGRSTNSFRTPNAISGSSALRGSAHAYNGGSRSFSRSNIGGNYRGSIRGGYTRNGHYYAGGYGGRTYGYGRGYGYGYRYSPWYSHRGFYYNRGFYGSLYYPRLGFSLGVLPYGYYPFFWGDAQFYYSGGYFYQYNNDQYTVVEPPIGAAINTLPSNAQAITINGQQYYESNGVYYLPVTKDDGSLVYQVAGKDGQLDTTATDQDNGGYDNGGGNPPPSNNQPAVAMPEIGDLFYSLPADTRKIRIGGQLYYVSPDDFYYQATVDQQGAKAYKVVGTPDDSPGN